MAEPPPSTLAGRTLLVVEDEYFLAQHLVHEIERSGASILGPASNVREALGLLEGATALDGAVLDVNLRGEMVYPLADALRARGVPFMFATGYDAAHLPSKYRHVTCCQKPVESDKVARALFD